MLLRGKQSIENLRPPVPQHCSLFETQDPTREMAVDYPCLNNPLDRTLTFNGILLYWYKSDYMGRVE
jgi:hypothetical protein